MAAESCHICQCRIDEPGVIWCSYPHPLSTVDGEALAVSQTIVAAAEKKLTGRELFDRLGGQFGMSGEQLFAEMKRRQAERRAR